MARRPPARGTRSARRRLSGKAAPRIPSADSPFPTLESFVLADGQITIGEMRPIACAAIAADHHVMYAALQRRPRETLMQLLQRLDAALLRALENEEFTDEING